MPDGTHLLTPHLPTTTHSQTNHTLSLASHTHH